ncbi:lipopolysaccharide transport system permease protein [Paenibacillus sp. PvP094]|uniref:ABC transporter permease n=1 Tax=Paenibacillus sp. PvP094 TaxID=3156394 RepID=UPI00339A6917
MKQSLLLYKNNKHLIFQLVKRDILQRYRGSNLGLLWSFFTPLFMLIIYTYFFGFVFNNKWGGALSDNKYEFALVLFCGLLVFNFFSEIITKSPSLMVGNTNLVKKVVFPLEILPIVLTGSALFHMFVSIVILFIGVLIVGTVHWTIIFLPLVIFPVILLSLGFSWFLSSLGVFIRDISQFIGLVMQALMFMSPIFYPISVIPEKLRFIYYINPLTYVVEDVRRVVMWGVFPNWEFTLIGFLLSLMVYFLGFSWFIKTKGGFSDVL